MHHARNILRNFLLVAALVSAYSLAGCQGTPEEQWHQQRALLSELQDTTVELHKAEVISDNDLLATEPIFHSARSHLNESAAEGYNISHIEIAREILRSAQRFFDRESNGQE